VTYRPAEAHRLDSLHHPGAFRGPVEELVWWDFVAGDPDYFFSLWYPPERDFLQARGVTLDDPERQNARLVVQRKRPVLHTRQRLILCLPGASDGSAMAPHPLFGDLNACFGEGLAAITIDVDAAGKAPGSWSQHFRLPAYTEEAPAPLPPPRAFLRVADPRQLPERETETPTSLEALLYYPYQWFFRHQIKLRQSSILTVVPDNRLFGNLAHRFLERLLRKAEPHWTRRTVEDWIDEQAPDILRKEGATLLLYGREPERIALINRLKYAAWSLLSLLQQNNWTVHEAELELTGHFGDIPLRGRADLVLERGEEKAIIDLKWRGRRRYADILRNAEDLQLLLYADLLPPPGRWAQTAYFIIRNGEMLVRDNRAFANLPPLVADAEQEVIYDALKERVLRTYRWRQQQVEAGQLEIRCAFTEGELEDHYGETLLDLLEMKTGDARYDDYRVLIGLVR
ncbi:MAG: PD-(D/E)XK nuclease family protein, partial [Lewinella sp.]|nr:PD-(D/E)XK nuclease family protein [Lewinella sp.]